ncbi:MAG: hypothetical protein IT438_03050 [Phycisphaerales bacterium]|nr:hypothetical protein [Phycisphaerales bacterium]
MSTNRTSRNNALAGLFVLICIGLFVLVITLLTGASERFVGTSSYIVDFSLADGAEGLERGAPVKLAGKRIGRVLSSDLRFERAAGSAADAPAEITGVEVRVEIRADVQLYEDARVNLVRPLLGSVSAINITSLRTRADAKAVGAGARIAGQIGPPGFLSQADYARVQDVLRRIDEWTAEIDPSVKPITEDVRATVANVKDLTGKANTSWDRWSGDVDVFLGDARKAGGRLDKIVTDATAGVESIKAGVEEVRAFVAKADEFIVRNRPVVDGTLDDIRELSRKAKGEAYDKVVAVLDDAQETMRHAASVAKGADELVTQKRPELADIVTNAGLAAQELKLATTEIRAAPWRLLYQPTKKELENELLYNSIRRYSRSLADLKATADALDSVTQQMALIQPGQVGAISSAEVAVLATRLRESIARSQEQERQFFERWIRPSEGAKE